MGPVDATLAGTAVVAGARQVEWSHWLSGAEEDGGALRDDHQDVPWAAVRDATLGADPNVLVIHHEPAQLATPGGGSIDGLPTNAAPADLTLSFYEPRGEAAQPVARVRTGAGRLEEGRRNVTGPGTAGSPCLGRSSLPPD